MSMKRDQVEGLKWKPFKEMQSTDATDADVEVHPKDTDADRLLLESESNSQKGKTQNF